MPVPSAVAIEIDIDPTDRTQSAVLPGKVITVDDRMTTLLDPTGVVQFVSNDQTRPSALSRAESGALQCGPGPQVVR